MNLDEYSKAMFGLAPSGQSAGDHILHAAMGISGESGEILDHIKKVTFNNRDFDTGHVIAELSDLFWYMNLMVHALGITWQQVIDTNVAKLSVRYPGLVYSHDRANNRSTDAEAKAMAEV